MEAQSSLSDACTAERLSFGLLISGQIHVGRIDGWQDLKQMCLLKAFHPLLIRDRSL